MRTSASFIAIAFLAALLAGCNSTSDKAPRTAVDSAPGIACDPLESRRANAPDQRTAFRGQTRACEADSNVELDVQVLADDLEHPWAVEPLPDGSLLITERPGRLRVVSATGQLGQPIGGLPAVDARGQGGLLDVALSPSFASDRTIFWSYAEPRDGGNGTAVARGVLSADHGTLSDVRVIFRVLPTYEGDAHFGSRLAFGPDGMLYITTGDRSDPYMRPFAQDYDSHLGKILRIAPDGSVPADNPFAGRSGAQPEIWSLGHRNIQAAAFDPEGRLWIVEHGTRGGDELNLITRGTNYGWPLQAYGVEYSGLQIARASTNPRGFQQPVYYWDPVIAPSGAQWYTGDAFPAWRGSLLVGGLRDGLLVRLVIANDRVTGEEHLLESRDRRIRDVRQGPDGNLYIVTDHDDGELWRVTPRI